MSRFFLILLGAAIALAIQSQSPFVDESSVNLLEQASADRKPLGKAKAPKTAKAPATKTKAAKPEKAAKPAKAEKAAKPAKAEKAAKPAKAEKAAKSVEKAAKSAKAEKTTGKPPKGKEAGHGKDAAHKDTAKKEAPLGKDTAKSHAKDTAKSHAKDTAKSHGKDTAHGKEAHAKDTAKAADPNRKRSASVTDHKDVGHKDTGKELKRATSSPAIVKKGDAKTDAKKGGDAKKLQRTNSLPDLDKKKPELKRVASQVGTIRPAKKLDAKAQAKADAKAAKEKKAAEEKAKQDWEQTVHDAKIRIGAEKAKKHMDTLLASPLSGPAGHTAKNVKTGPVTTLPSNSDTKKVRVTKDNIGGVLNFANTKPLTDEQKASHLKKLQETAKSNEAEKKKLLLMKVVNQIKEEKAFAKSYMDDYLHGHHYDEDTKNGAKIGADIRNQMAKDLTSQLPNIAASYLPGSAGKYFAERARKNMEKRKWNNVMNNGLEDAKEALLKHQAQTQEIEAMKKAGTWVDG